MTALLATAALAADTLTLLDDLAALPGPEHRPARTEQLDTDTGPLVLTRCRCGRLFDTAGMTRHLDDSAAALAASTDPTAPRRTA